MKTKYNRSRNKMRKINLDKMANGKDKDFILQFGGAEFIIQYRVENATRPGHPFIDIVVAPEDPAMRVDLCDDDGNPVDLTKVGHPRKKQVSQILLGMKLLGIQ
jgi:hypothetical protein